jgi:MoaA/NifB/PqqE/SkfB family radical SAM enzyme
MSLLAAQISYRLFRAFGWPGVLPLNYTVSVTSRCNYRCATCRIWSKQLPEMSRQDYSQLFRSLGNSPFWVTFSGGEPFLRDDFPGIVDDFCRFCRPRVVNIPTNGSLPQLVSDSLKKLTSDHRDISFIVNVSIDSTGDRQDLIRGSRDAYHKATKTLRVLKELKASNLTAGIGTVISNSNLRDFARDREEILKLGADSAVAEIAEEREELANRDGDITPDAESYKKAADILIAEIDKERKKELAGVAQVFRKNYYSYVYRVLKGGPGLKCYAGWASVQIMPDGEVWACCIRGDRMGNVRDFGLDFKKLWRSPQAERARSEIKQRGCACPLANAAYTNMMFDLKTSLKVMSRMLFRI